MLNVVIDRFRNAIEKRSVFTYAGSLNYWDMATGGSEKGMSFRAKLQGMLTGYSYEMLVNEQMEADLKFLEGKVDELDEVTRRMLVKTRKSYDDYSKIPKEEVEAFSKLQLEAEQVWEKAKDKADFSMFADYLKRLIEFQKKFVGYRGYEGHPYNTLLDDYEEGMTVDKLDEFFAELKTTIVPLVKAINESSVKVDDSFVRKSYSIEKQKELAEDVLNVIGYDFNAGMLKESVHPFSMGLNPNDVRITVNYHENEPLASFYAAAHEGGHGIYEQNVNTELMMTGLCEGASSGIHESQSRFYENVLCRSEAFWEYYYQRVQNLFPEILKDVSSQEYYKACNKVAPSFIRIEADELTYSLHIMIRYEIEKELFSGDIDVNELPALWNKKVKEYLGLDVPSDDLGILQDVHWSNALFGYFPTYALGNAYASQIAATINKEFSIDEKLRKGQCMEITKWLNDKIHNMGSMKKPDEILELVTGEGLNAKYYTDYLKEKFSSIYDLQK